MNGVRYSSFIRPSGASWRYRIDALQVALDKLP
jgi:hypothetical protein